MGFKISVTTQNSINSGKLAKRDKYLLFPQSQDFNKSDYVILDLKRALLPWIELMGKNC